MATGKITVNRRRALVIALSSTAAGALPVLPAAAIPADPVLKLIAEHRWATARWTQRAQWLAAIEADPLADDDAIDHVTGLFNEALEAVDAAERAILMARPTSMAGVAATLEFLHAHYGQFHGLAEEVDTLANLAAALRQLITGGAV